MKPLLLLVSFLHLDIDSGLIRARQWPDSAPIPIGSLSKPFIALAYAATHQFQYPTLECRHCWSPKSHGRLALPNAIANSCNSYFDQLRLAAGPSALATIAERYALPSIDHAPPEAILRAYVELHRRRAEPGVAPILEGMRLAARIGTAKALQRDAYAKTGTAACTHSEKAPGDGFAVVLIPPHQPRTALLVRLHGRPGAHAAREARALLE